MVIDQVNLGSRTLYPGRELLAGHEHIHIGKRAIQILSVLARAHGETVTKQELLDEVWPDTTVEENTLPVHVVALRKALGPEAGRLKTVHGIGYRLEVDPEPKTVAPDGDVGAGNFPTVTNRLVGEATLAKFAGQRARLMLILVAAIAVLAIVAVNFARSGTSFVDVEAPLYVSPPRTAGGEATRLVGLEVDGAVKDAMGRSGFALLDPDADGALPRAAELVLHSSVTTASGRYITQVSLEHRPSETAIWTRSFEAGPGATRRMAEQVAASLVRTIYTMREAAKQPDTRFDAATMALHLRGSEILRNRQIGNDASASEIYRQVVKAYPGSATAHALLAISLQVDAMSAPPDLRAQLLGELRREAQEAIGIAPEASGAAYDALAIAQAIENPNDLAGYEDAILAGIEAVPDFAFLHMRECRFLIESGLNQRALEYCRRAIALHPYAEPALHTYARALAAANEPAGATRFIDRAAYLFPDHLHIRRTRFEMAVFGGRPSLALAILGAPEDLPGEINPQQAAFWRDFVTAEDGRSEAEKNALAQRIMALFEAEKMAPDWAVMALATLGHETLAFDVLGQKRPMGAIPGMGAHYLFHPSTRSLRADPRFWDNVARLGLAQYWLETGTWPDFCGREIAREICMKQSRLALRQVS